jgi:hypothetical protein
MPTARANNPAKPRRTDAGTVKLTDRDITGLTLWFLAIARADLALSPGR